MNKNRKNEIQSKIYFFLTLFFLLIIHTESFTYFKAFNLLSENILLITDEGIIKYDPLTKNQTLVQSSNLITSINDLDAISFVQSPSDDGGYIFCRLKTYIFIFDENLNNNNQNFDVSQISNLPCSLNSYKTSDGKITLIISLIKQQSLKIIMYEININEEQNFAILFNEITYTHKNQENDNKINLSPYGITCELIASNEYTNKLLACFFLEVPNYNIVGSIFNPENLNFLYLTKNSRKIKTSLKINSAISSNFENIFICFIGSDNLLYCLLYDSKNNILKDIIELGIFCKYSTRYNTGVKYINQIQEYIVFCSEESEMKFIKFDQYIKIKGFSVDNDKCYTVVNVTNDNYNEINSFNLLYFKNDSNFYVLKSVYNDNNQPFFYSMNIFETCNIKIEIEQLNNYIESINSSSISILSTIPLLPTTSLEKTPTIPLTTIFEIENDVPTTTIKIKDELYTTTLENKNELLTTILENNDELPITTSDIKDKLPLATILEIKDELNTTIIENKDELTSTILENKDELSSTILQIKDELSSTTFEIKKELFSSILENKDELSSTILQIKDDVTTTVLDIQDNLNTIILEIKDDVTSTILEIKDELNTTILENKNELPLTTSEIKDELHSTTFEIKDDVISTTLEIKDELNTTILENKDELPSTILEIKDKLLTTTLDIENESSILYLTSISSSLFSTTIFPSSSIIFNKFIIDNNITFYLDGDIIKCNINHTKEEFEKIIDEFIDIIETGKKYKIIGRDYNITINSNNSFKSSFADLSICQEFLRQKYNKSSDELFNILQIEIDKINEKALTNQIEYAIYDGKKRKLDLSICKNIPIKVIYDIKDKGNFLNKSMISYYSKLGIDIFDSEDPFFNDLCYPFTISDSDIILKDRVLDIFQNYSLCDNECEYDKINIEDMSVTCSCKVKLEINMKVSPPDFKEIIQDTFKDSNFGVVRCYDLAFNFNNKMNNYGFLLFLVFFLFNNICFILYYIKGIKSVVIFVYKEMEKNNYITKIQNPRKKNYCKTIIEDQANKSNNFYNSMNLLNQNQIMKMKKNKTIKNEIKFNKTNKNYLQGNSKINNNKPIIVSNFKTYKNIKKLTNNLFNSSKNRLNAKFLKIKKANYPKLNKEGKFPGYYNLIQINANNSKNNKPPESNYILDNYNYDQAIKYEKRSFWRIYFICLLSKENIINTFFFKSPLEIQPLRLSIFLFSYACDFALNALFYLNQKISEKYHYDGDSLYLFIFINNMTIILSSTVFSYLLEKFLDSLTNSKGAIEQLFRIEEKKMRKNNKYKVNSIQKKIILKKLLKIYKIMKIKIICYIIIQFLIMLFFLYFITAFCEVYKNTQLSWLLDSFTSFLLSFPIELLISFLIAILYILAIKKKNKRIYNLVLYFYSLG